MPLCYPKCMEHICKLCGETVFECCQIENTSNNVKKTINWRCWHYNCLLFTLRLKLLAVKSNSRKFPQGSQCLLREKLSRDRPSVLVAFLCVIFIHVCRHELLLLSLVSFSIIDAHEITFTPSEYILLSFEKRHFYRRIVWTEQHRFKELVVKTVRPKRQSKWFFTVSVPINRSAWQQSKRRRVAPLAQHNRNKNNSNSKKFAWKLHLSTWK